MPDPLRELEQFRRRRVRSEPDLSIGPIVRAAADSARRTERGLGDLLELWEAVVPEHLAARCALVGLQAGQLEVHADSASVRYELDRLLRGGALRQMQRAYRGTLVRVRVRLGGASGSGRERS